jgi:hypothetical protein
MAENDMLRSFFRLDLSDRLPPQSRVMRALVEKGLVIDLKSIEPDVDSVAVRFSWFSSFRYSDESAGWRELVEPLRKVFGYRTSLVEDPQSSLISWVAAQTDLTKENSPPPALLHPHHTRRGHRGDFYRGANDRTFEVVAISGIALREAALASIPVPCTNTEETTDIIDEECAP